MLDRKRMFHFSLFTLLGFPMIAYLAMFFDDPVIFFKWFESCSLLALFLGAIAGSIAGFIGLLLLRLKCFDATKEFFVDLFRPLAPRFYHVVFYSLCAAIGEEILFRGFMQHFLGIVWTALIFVLVHGYLNPKRMPLFLFGIYLVGFSLILGYLMREWNIYAAIMAHFIYDVIMFSRLMYEIKKKNARLAVSVDHS